MEGPRGFPKNIRICYNRCTLLDINTFPRLQETIYVFSESELSFYMSSDKYLIVVSEIYELHLVLLGYHFATYVGTTPHPGCNRHHQDSSSVSRESP